MLVGFTQKHNFNAELTASQLLKHTQLQALALQSDRQSEHSNESFAINDRKKGVLASHLLATSISDVDSDRDDFISQNDSDTNYLRTASAKQEKENSGDKRSSITS